VSAASTVSGRCGGSGRTKGHGLVESEPDRVGAFLAAGDNTDRGTELTERVHYHVHHVRWSGGDYLVDTAGSQQAPHGVYQKRSPTHGGKRLRDGGAEMYSPTGRGHERAYRHE
jgi:hypothetical protein